MCLHTCVYCQESAVCLHRNAWFASLGCLWRLARQDESLFGPSPTQTQRRTQRRSAEPNGALNSFFSGEGTTQLGAGGRSSTRNAGGDTQQLVTKDGIRTLRCVAREKVEERR